MHRIVPYDRHEDWKEIYCARARTKKHNSPKALSLNRSTRVRLYKPRRPARYARTDHDRYIVKVAFDVSLVEIENSKNLLRKLLR